MERQQPIWGDKTFQQYADRLASLVWADGFDGALPPLENTSDELQATVATFRNRPAGQFILKMFEVYRPTLRRDNAE